MLLSVCLPGLGYAYVGRWTGALVSLAVVVALFMVRQWALLGLFWAVQVVASGGAVRRWNRENAADFTAPVPPPARGTASEPPVPDVPAPLPVPPSAPPSVSAPPESPGSVESPERPARPSVTGPRLDPAQFLERLREGWNEHLSGRMGDEEFGELKHDLIARVHAHGMDEGMALMETASELVTEGLLTQRERSTLQWQAGRP